MDTATVDLLIRRDLPAARTGDRDAYGRIVAACQNTVTAIALSIVRDVPSSEDIAQDAFLKTWQHLRRLQNPDSFLPWLRQVTRNHARDHLRDRIRAPRACEDAEAAIAAAADPAPSPMHALIDEERLHAATELISALPAESRETLLLFYREGQSSQQVALLLGLSDAAVRKRLSRARQAVRTDLLARFGEFAETSAPAAGFASVVVSALVLTSPPAAAGVFSATVGVAGAAGAKTLGKVLLGAAGTFGIALATAAAAIGWDLRRQLRRAVDDEERRGLKRIALVNTLAVVCYSIALFSMHLNGHRGWAIGVAANLVFVGVVFWQALVTHPRVLARRHAREMETDPAGATRRRRRERVLCWLGLILGTAGGLGGNFAAVMLSGHA